MIAAVANPTGKRRDLAGRAQVPSLPGDSTCAGRWSFAYTIQYRLSEILLVTIFFEIINKHLQSGDQVYIRLYNKGSRFWGLVNNRLIGLTRGCPSIRPAYIIVVFVLSLIVLAVALVPQSAVSQASPYYIGVIVGGDGPNGGETTLQGLLTGKGYTAYYVYPYEVSYSNLSSCSAIVSMGDYPEFNSDIIMPLLNNGNNVLLLGTGVWSLGGNGEGFSQYLNIADNSAFL
ncbi:MAG TPA: hypothetical protein VGJ92_11885, partial [Methanocella sp.]